ncbi:MAG: electron transfer flavoprotein subunit beta, partial [Fusobacterium sp. JB020]|nr:electron transfer flavoprotein subunit beta [Fusobacterium sp. JB020]
LGIPQISYLKELEYNEDAKTIKVKRVVEDGYYLLEAELPALVTVLAEANQPRYMRVGNIVDAFNKEVEVWTTENVKIEAEKLGLKGSPTQVKKSFTKGAKQAGKVFNDLDTKQAVNLIVEKLKEKFVI